MRILLLTQWFYPEPFFKGLPFARALRESGHDVEILTGFPNYPGGSIYDGYDLRVKAIEIVDGFTVNRVWLYPSHDRSTLRRIANYLSFAISATALGWQLIRRPDVIYAYQPPATIGLPAAVLGRIWHVPYVLDVQDLWPDTVVSSGMLSNGMLLRVLHGFCRWVYHQASHITVLSRGFRDTLIDRGISPGKITVIANWCDEQALACEGEGTMQRTNMGLGGKFVVLFAGTLGKSQDLDSVLDAAAICAVTIPDAAFVIAGDGTESQRLRARAIGLSNVTFVGHRPPESMGALFSMADALLVHLRDEPLFRVTIPSKTQAYLLAGRPIIMGVRGDAADMIRDSGAGIPVTPGDGAAIAQGVVKLSGMTSAEREAMGASGRRYYWKHLSQKVGVRAFEDVFAAAVGFSRVTKSASGSGSPAD